MKQKIKAVLVESYDLQTENRKVYS